MQSDLSNMQFDLSNKQNSCQIVKICSVRRFYSCTFGIFFVILRRQ